MSLMANLSLTSLSLFVQGFPCLFVLLLCTHKCVVVCELMREDLVGCQFPDFLQSREPGMGDWTWKYDGDTHVGKVHGGVYTICSNQNSRERDSRRRENSCQKSIQRRKCVRQFGDNVFAVQHDEYRPSYQCVQFIVRSPIVIQLAISDIWIQVDDVCNQNMTLDHSPWISIKHYKSTIVHCPFTGGYNFQEISEYTRDHAQKRLCRYVVAYDRGAPVRMESDCIEKEGIHLHFREKQCLPDKSYFSISQKLVCMATWRMDGDGFTMLRKENDRSFYCMRVIFENDEVTEIVLYLDWECYRGSDLSARGAKLSYSTPYATFRKAEKRIISIPCSDELTTCNSNLELDCKQCMQTCKECLNTTGYQCHFDEDVVGNWTVREPHKSRYQLHIHKHALQHSRLGILHCLTFDPVMWIALRAILWGTYQNGCYPRFLCLYYETPTTSVMRYRMSNILQWPLKLSDESICHEKNFMVTPDFDDPRDRYEERPWEIALRSSETIHRMPCIYPNELPDTASFVDNRNRSGCITLRSRTSPKTITVMYTERMFDPQHEHSYLTHGEKHHYMCIAALTFVTTFKTVITLTQGDEHEALCWMVYNHRTLIVVDTSSCNEQTALGIEQREEKYTQHLKWYLTLKAGGNDAEAFCQSVSEDSKKEESHQEFQHYAKNNSGIIVCSSPPICLSLVLLCTSLLYQWVQITAGSTAMRYACADK